MFVLKTSAGIGSPLSIRKDMDDSGWMVETKKQVELCFVLVVGTQAKSKRYILVTTVCV